MVGMDPTYCNVVDLAIIRNDDDIPSDCHVERMIGLWLLNLSRDFDRRKSQKILVLKCQRLFVCSSRRYPRAEG